MQVGKGRGMGPGCGVVGAGHIHIGMEERRARAQTALVKGSARTLRVDGRPSRTSHRGSNSIGAGVGVGVAWVV